MQLYAKSIKRSQSRGNKQNTQQKSIYGAKLVPNHIKKLLLKKVEQTSLIDQTYKFGDD